MNTSNAVSCIKIGKKELKILVFDQLTKKVIWRKVFSYDFEVFDNSGVIVSPRQVASFIQNIFGEYKLPRRTRVSLSFEYLNINNLLLPSISGAELHQIILDEAAHESVYSFTNEKVAVAYQMLEDKINEDGILSVEVFAVTTLQSAINQVMEVFKNTDIALESISPALWGLRQYLTRYLTNPAKPMILILVSNDDAEFYIWNGEFPNWCHYINAGIKEPERLQNEAITSLEYFNKRFSSEDLVSRVVVVGEKCELKLGDNATIEYIFEDEWPDLIGLALITKDYHVLNFIPQTIQTTLTSYTLIINKFWPLIIGGLFCLNSIAGWNLVFGNQRLAQMKGESLRLQNLLRTKKEQLSPVMIQPAGTRFKFQVLLEKLQGIVPKDMMFDKLLLDIENKNIQIEGFCLSQINLNIFLETLSQIKGIKSVNEIESSQQNRADLAGYAFRCNVTFGEDFSNGQ